jgi:hypothetical protein
MMSNLIPNKKGFLKHALILAIAGFSTVLTSCIKNNDNGNQIVRDVSALSIVNASPNARNINIFIDDQRLNSTGIPYLQGFPYITAYAGARKIVVTDAAASTEKAKKTITLKPNTYYSLYIAGVGANTDSLDYVVATDTIQTPTAGKARIRFVHLSPDVAAVDMGVDGQASLFTNQSYKSISKVIEVAPISGTLVLKDKATGAVVAKLENAKIDAGNNYTIFAKGAAAATVNDLKPGLRIINHNAL